MQEKARERGENVDDTLDDSLASMNFTMAFDAAAEDGEDSMPAADFGN